MKRARRWFAVVAVFLAFVGAREGGAQLDDDVAPPGSPFPLFPHFVGALDDRCVVSILNRVAHVQPDGSWEIDNVPTNFGPIRARATCVVDGETIAGQSDPFTVPQNGVVRAGWIVFLEQVPVPTGLEITSAPSTLMSAGATGQLTVRARFSDGSTRDVTTDPSTTYTASRPAIATVSPAGVVTAIASGTAVITILHEAVSGFVTVPVTLSSTDTDGDGIPDDVEIANGLNPNDPTDAAEDLDGDGLTNLQEYRIGTDMRNPDTDGDGLLDGVEVFGTDGYVTNPLVADTDGDGIPDGVEIETGSDPTDPTSYNLARALQSFDVMPASFALTVNTVVGQASQQLKVTGHLIDGKTSIDLTSTGRRTAYTSSDLTVCTLGPPDGRVFGAGNGTCTITVSNSGFSAQAIGTVTTFSPVALSFIAIPGFANAVDVSGNFAYVAAGAAGLQVVDVMDRTNPHLVGAFATPGNANDVRVAGTAAFVAAGGAGLRILDVTDPTHPAALGASATHGGATDLVVRGNQAIVAEGAAGLEVFDVTDRTAPVAVGALVTLGGAQGVDVSLDGSLAVVAERATGVEVIDLRDPHHPASLSSVSTGGDARDVRLDGAFALVADYAQSFTTVDLTDPRHPAVRASTPRASGGLLTDLALAGPFAFGADVFFVNGVPIIDVTDPANPLPRAILDFSRFRDDNGTGIAVDGSYVYLTAEQATIGTEDGTMGDTRLYIGQYLALQDTAGIPPSVRITAPAPGATVVEGAKLPVTVDATDDVAVVAVHLFVNGALAATDTSPPYQFTITVPSGMPTLTLGAVAVDPGNNAGMAVDVVLPVVPDPGTTVVGQVVDSSATPVAGATVTCQGVGGATAADGTFSIADVPTVRGDIRCSAAFGTLTGAVLTGGSAPVAPVPGGTTHAGTITVVQGQVFYSRVASSGATDGTVWNINGDGSADHQVTTGEWPRLSRDGRYIVFLRDNANPTRGNVYVRDLQLGTETRVFSNPDFVVNFDWSADSSQIVLDFECSIYAMNRDGSNFHQLVGGTDCFDDAPVLSPVDGTIAFHNAHFGLFLANPDGTGRRLIPNTTPGDFWPAWSPDGQWLSFGHSSSGNFLTIDNYFKTRPDGSSRTQLTFLDPTTGDVLGPGRSWTADGARLVVPGTIQGARTLRAIATDGSGLFAVPTTAGAPIDFVGSVTGTVVAPVTP